MTTLGSGVDGAVRRVETTYEVRGMVEMVTNYDAMTSGSAVNEVKFTYNSFAQLTLSEQEHGGAVDGSTLEVQYYYETGSSNTIRPMTVTYPDGRTLTYEYGAALSPRSHHSESRMVERTPVTSIR